MGHRNRLLAAWGALTVFAIASVVSGLDRASESRLGAAKWVPAPFRVSSARELARQQMANGHAALAIVNARSSVARDPADARSVGLYGAALELSGKATAAREAFTVAGAMGWREPLTQLYWMSVAFEERNFRVATLRLDAVLRQAPEYPGHMELLAAVEAYPEGREQLAKRLADAPAWRDSYFSESSALPPSSQILRAEVARRLAEAEGMRDCQVVGGLVTSLTRIREFASARMVWQAHCRHPEDSSFLSDPGFSRVDPKRHGTEFEWALSDDSAVGVMLGPKHGFSGRALTVESTSERETAFATQMTVLPPGTYTASWLARDSDGKPAADVGLSVSCNRDMPQNRQTTLRDPQTARWDATFTVTADCPAQWLSLRISPGTRTATIDDIAIAKR